MEKFGLLQLLSAFAKNAQEEGEKPQQNIFDIFTDSSKQNTPTNQPNAPFAETNTCNTQNNGGIFSTEIRQRQFNSILLRHEEISRRIDRRNKH